MKELERAYEDYEAHLAAAPRRRDYSSWEAFDIVFDEWRVEAKRLKDRVWELEQIGFSLWERGYDDRTKTPH